MPIYEYRCQSCLHEFEIMQKITEDALTLCPECGKDTLGKLISRSSFQLKGSGWYATDFKDSGKKAETSSETKSEVKTESKSDTPSSTETKTETKSETKTTTSSTPKSEDK